MPLMPCEVNGKKGAKWGNSGKCYTEDNMGENRRKAVLQGISYEGSDKVNKMLRSKGTIQAFGGYENYLLVKSILEEFYPRGRTDELLEGYGKYFSKSDDEIDNAGENSMQYRNPTNDSGNEFVGEKTSIRKDNADDDDNSMAGQSESAVASIFEGYSHEDIIVILDNLAYAYVSQKTRDDMDSSDFGLPSEKKFPVADERHFHAAIKLMGRESPEKQAEIKKNLKRIASKKGYKLPDSWSKEDAGNQPANTGI